LGFFIKEIMLFIQSAYEYLVANSMRQEHYRVGQFANQEYTIKIEKDVTNQRSVVVGSLTVHAEQAMQLLLLISTLKTSGSSHITLFSPYLGYQRQDLIQHGLSQGLNFATDLLRTVGVDEIITLEPHNLTNLTTLSLPVYSYGGQIFFEEEVAHFINGGFGFVFPDAGAAVRYDWLLEKFPAALHGCFVKSRFHDLVHLTSFEGKVGKKVIVYDDILDSGQTLVQVCIALKSMGVEEIVIFVVHAFFHGMAWQELFNLGVIMIYCTNSIPAADQIKHAGVKVQSISFLLQKFI
jgi:ribose-phosphate pyrophosphokinase